MAFELEQRERDGVQILAPKGRLTIGEPVAELRKTFEDLLATNQRYVVLDLTLTEYIDSSALGCLVMLHTRAQKAGGAMPMFGLSQRSVDLLILTKLVTVFSVFDNEIDAVNSCFADRKTNHFDILSFVQGQDPQA